jgi:hypothetical protein
LIVGHLFISFLKILLFPLYLIKFAFDFSNFLVRKKQT